MFRDEPLPADMLGVLLPMADQPGWARKWGIVSWIGSFPEGTFTDGPDLAVMLDGAPGRAAEHLKELTKARILERDPPENSRRFWYRVNPRWWDWAVNWRHDVREVEIRLSHWARVRSTHPLTLLSARPYGARYPRISARLMARANEEWARASYPVARGSMARASDETAEAPGPGRAPKDRALAEPVARAIDRAQNGGRPERAIQSARSLTLVTNDSLPASPDEKESTSIPEGELRAVRRAVAARCVPGRGRQRPAVWGQPAKLLDELVASHGAGAVVEAAGRIPAGELVPQAFVEQLADDLDAAGGEALALAPDPVADRQRLEGRVAAVRQDIANHEANGYPVPQELVDELANLTEQLGATA